jgi:hypothetical protein
MNPVFVLVALWCMTIGATVIMDRGPDEEDGP